MKINPSFVLRASLLPLCVLAASCSRRAPAPPAAIPVHTTTVTQRAVPLTLSAVGLVQPLHTVAVQSQVTGVIEKIHFTEGDEVRAGDLLVSLDQRPFRASLASAQAGLTQARANAEKAEGDRQRYTELHAKQAVSDSDFAQYVTVAADARANVAVQEAALATAQLDLDYTMIRAPIGGRTSRLGLREGSLVKANDSTQPLLTLNQMAPIGVAFSLPESNLAALREALAAGEVAVTAQIQADHAKPVTGRLDFLDNTVGPTTGTIALRATFANPGTALWPGQFVNVTVHIGTLPDALVVPATAVIVGQAGSQVFVVKADHTVELRAVRTGVTDAHDIVLLDAVKVGETVVTDGQLRLVPGASVTVKDPAAPAAPANAPRSSQP